MLYIMCLVALWPVVWSQAVLRHGVLYSLVPNSKNQLEKVVKIALSNQGFFWSGIGSLKNTQSALVFEEGRQGFESALSSARITFFQEPLTASLLIAFNTSETGIQDPQNFTDLKNEKQQKVSKNIIDTILNKAPLLLPEVPFALRHRVGSYVTYDKKTGLLVTSDNYEPEWIVYKTLNKDVTLSNVRNKELIITTKMHETIGSRVVSALAMSLKTNNSISKIYLQTVGLDNKTFLTIAVNGSFVAYCLRCGRENGNKSELFYLVETAERAAAFSTIHYFAVVEKQQIIRISPTQSGRSETAEVFKFDYKNYLKQTTLSLITYSTLDLSNVIIRYTNYQPISDTTFFKYNVIANKAEKIAKAMYPSSTKTKFLFENAHGYNYNITADFSLYGSYTTPTSSLNEVSVLITKAKNLHYDFSEIILLELYAEGSIGCDEKLCGPVYYIEDAVASEIFKTSNERPYDGEILCDKFYFKNCQLLVKNKGKAYLQSQIKGTISIKNSKLSGSSNCELA